MRKWYLITFIYLVIEACSYNYFIVPQLMNRMSSTDTPLNTLKKLQDKQKELQSPYVVLSGKLAP